MASEHITTAAPNIPLLSAKETALRLKCAPDYVGKLCREGKLQGEIVNGAWFVAEDSILTFEKARAEAKLKRSAELAQQRQIEKESYRKNGEISAPVLAISETPVNAHGFKPGSWSRVAVAALGIAFLFSTVVYAGSAKHSQDAFEGSTLPQSSSLAAIDSGFFGATPQNTIPAESDTSDTQNFFEKILAFFFGGSHVAVVQQPVITVTTTPVKTIAQTTPVVTQVQTHTTQTAPKQTIIQNNTYPVIERTVVQSGTGGVSQASLDAQLAALQTKISQQIFSNTNSAPGPVYSSGGFTNNIALAQIINQLSNVAISGGSITNASISGGSISGVTLSTSDLSGLVGIANGGTGTSTAPTYGQLLLGNNSGGYDLISTSSLGISGVSTFTGLSDAPHSLATGDLIYAASSSQLATLHIGSNGQVLKIQGGLPVWGTDLQGSGGAGAFATTSDNLALYPADPTQVVILGNNATTTTGNIFEVTGNSLFRGQVTAYKTTTAPNFVATSSSVASAFPFASSTVLTVSGIGYFGTASTSNLTISNTPNALLSTNAAGVVGATSVSAPLAFSGNTLSITQSGLASNGYLSSGDFTNFNNKISSSSLSATYPLAYNSATGVFSTAFGTTTANTFSALNTFNGGVTANILNVGTSAVIASTTLTGNTVLANATTSTFAITNVSGALLKTLSNGAVVAALAGTDYQAAGNYATFAYPFIGNATTTNIAFNGGATISTLTLTNALSIANGGTGTSTAPTYGKLLLGNNAGGYDLVSTSSLGIAGGGGGVSFGQAFEINGFGALAPTTTIGIAINASSTIGNGSQAGGLTISGGATTTGDAFFNGKIVVGGASPLFNSSLTVYATGSNRAFSLRSNFPKADTIDQPTLFSLASNDANNPQELDVSSVGGSTFASRSFVFQTGESGVSNGGNLLFQRDAGRVGIATSSPGSLFAIGDTNGIDFSTGTSTFSSDGGINLLNGCFAVNGVCITSTSGGSSFAYPFLSNATTTQLAFNGGATFAGATTTSFAVNGSSTVSGQFNATGGATISALTVGSLAGSGTSCVQADNSGVLSVTGSACGSGGGGSVNSVSNLDGTLTISPTSGAVIASLNPAHANIFTALQQFNGNASTSQLSATKAYFGGTATTTIDSFGNIAVGGALQSLNSNLFASTTLGGNTLLANATTTNFAITGISSALLKTLSNGAVVAAIAGTDYQAAGNYSTFSYPFPSNATSTSIAFNGGLTGILTGSVVGNASTATSLQTGRTINGITFDGTSNITVTAASSTLLVDSNTFSGNNTFSSLITGSVSGNAGTATTLQTSRNINGVAFNGSADITVTAAAGTLTGSTLNSGVTASSLTSVGTLGTLSVSGLATLTGGILTNASSTFGNFTALNATTTSFAVIGSSTISSVLNVGGSINANGNFTVLGNTTLANATSTNQFSGRITSNTAAFGQTATSSFAANGALTLAQALTVANGGTGSTTLGGILTGNGTGAINSLVVGSGLTFDGTTLSTNGAGITAIGPTGQTQTGGTQIFATSTTGTDFTITATANTQTFNLPFASATATGKLAASDFTNFNNKISSSSLSGQSVISYNSGTGVITTQAGTFASGDYVFPNKLTVSGNASTSQISSGAAYFGSTATSSFAANGALTLAQALSIANGGTNNTSFATNSLLYFDGTKIAATSSTLYVGSLVATTSTATSTLNGGLAVANSLFVLQNGSIGIGNSTPTKTLDVTGTGKFSGTLTLSSNASCVGGQALQTDVQGNVSCGTVSFVGITTAGGWSTDSVGDVTLATTSDRVGLGATSTPYAKLAILSGGAATTTLALVPASGATANILDVYNTSGQLASVITAGNNFGLGTTSPSQRLSVQGNALVSGILGVATIAATGTVSVGGNLGVGTTSPASHLAIAGGNITHIAAGNPTVATTVPEVTGHAYGSYVSGHYAYVADYEGGLRILDVSNPAQPSAVGSNSSYTGSPKARAVVVAGKYAYVADENIGLAIFDVSKTSAPSLVGTYNLTGASYSLALSGNYVFIVDSANNATRVIDVSNPASPTLAGSFTSISPEGVAIQGKYLFIADFSPAVRVVDISNPAKPTLVGSYVGTAANSPTAVYVSGKYLYVADQATGFYSLNISNPVTPVLVGKYPASGLSNHYTGVQVSGTNAYVSNNSGNTLVLDLSNAATPTLVGSVAAAGNPNSIFVSGKYAYVSDNDQGFDVVDINGITAPAANIGSLAVNTVDVSDNLNVGGDGYFGSGIDVGASGIFSRGSLAVFGTTTLQNFTAGNGTTTNATTTTFFSTLASSTNLFASIATLNSATINTLSLVNALSVASGGTGSTTLGGILTGNGTGAVTSAIVSAPLTFTSNTLSITQAGLSQNGYLSSTDFTTFNNKISSTSLSGAGAVTYSPTTGVIGLSTVGISNGGTNATAQTTNGINYFDGTKITSGNALTFDGTHVGIGTTSAAQLLTLSAADTGTVLTSAGLASLSIINSDTTANNTSDLVFKTADTGGTTVVGTKFAAVFTSHAPGAVSADLALLTRNAGTLSEKLRITAAGNVGIGTTSPFATLSVQGNGYLSGNLIAANITATGTLSVTGGTTLASATSTSFAVTGSSTVTGQFNATGGATFGSVTAGALTASSFTGAGTGLTGTASGLSIGGNALTATTLQTTRNINGVAFNGSADITVTAAAGTLTGSTLNSGVTASSLTSVGTLTALTVSGNTSLQNASTTNLSANTIAFGGTGTTTVSSNGTLTTPALTIGSLSGLLKATAGVVSVATAGTDYATPATVAAAFPWTPTTAFGTAANATSTLIGFNNGLYSLASSTIGNGTQAGGLTVNGGATTTGIFKVGLGTQALVGTNEQIVNNQNGAAGIAVHNSNSGNETALFAGASGDGSVGSVSNNDFKIQTNNTEVARFTALGNFGVGSSSPFAKLSVQARATDTNTTLFAIGSSTQSATTTLFSVSNNGSTTIANGVNISGGCFAVNGTCLPNAAITALGPLGQTQSGPTIIQATSTTGTDFTITASGNTITYNLPSSSATNRGLLTAADWTTFNSKAGLGANTFTGLQQFTAGASTTQLSVFNQAYFGATATSTFTSTGALGIGTTTPWGLLSINPVAGNTQPSFVIGSSTLTQFVVTNAGNVGVGTTSPYARFSVSQTAAVSQFSLAYDGSDATDLRTDATGNLWIVPQGSAGGNVLMTNDNLWVCTGGSITSNTCPAGTPSGKGNLIVQNKISIGTTTPTSQFTIASSTNAGIVDFISLGTNLTPREIFGSTGSTTNIVLDNSAGVFRIFSSKANDGTNGTALFNIDGGSGNVGIGSSSPSQGLSIAQKLYVSAGNPSTIGTATSTFQGDVLITGKLDVSTIDPVYTIDGTKYATYGLSGVGVKEEISTTVTLANKNTDGKYEYDIDFSKLEKGSDLWLFYQVTTFGTDWKNLVANLTPGFDGTVYYSKNPATNTLRVVSSAPGEVSVRLVATRFDSATWSNVRPDQNGGFAGFQLQSK